MIIAIDFDGTIVEPRFPEIGPLIPYSIRYLKIWKREGHQLILWTCREGVYLQEAVSFCKSQGIEFDKVNENIRRFNDNSSRKIWADFYVDDRCGFEVNRVWRAVHRQVMG